MAKTVAEIRQYLKQKIKELQKSINEVDVFNCSQQILTDALCNRQARNTLMELQIFIDSENS